MILSDAEEAITNNQRAKCRKVLKVLLIASICVQCFLWLFSSVQLRGTVLLEQETVKVEQLTHVHTVQVLPLNQNCTIAGDLQKIMHDPAKSKITVILKRYRRCSKPQLIGRLSGPALTTVKWDRHVNTDENDWDGESLIGYYHVPMPGKYFIEIIVTTCVELTFNTDIKPICLEDPAHHRCTMDNATINVIDTTIQNKMQEKAIGYWFYEGDEQVPLYTRYQPQVCSRKMADPVCAATELSRFDPYKFKFSADFDLKDHLKGKEGVVCFGGASHGSLLGYFTSNILRQMEDNNVSGIYHESKGTMKYIAYARDFASRRGRQKVQNMINENCTKMVIGTGQWDASFDRSTPTSFEQYESDLKVTMELLLSMVQQTNIELYFRSTHYNPIGFIHGSCPPKDWRNPPVIDMYNQIMKRLCNMYNITFIGTDDIIGVTWDRARDWNHYNDTSGLVEAEYMLFKLFSNKQ